MNTLYIYDCIGGSLKTVNNFPAQIGSSSLSVCSIEMTGDAGVIIGTGPSGCSFFPQTSSDTPAEVNGQPISVSVSIPLDQEMLVSIGDALFVLYWTSNPSLAESIFNAYSMDSWFMFDTTGNKWVGPFALQKWATDPMLSQVNTWVSMSGMRKGMCKSTFLQTLAKKKYAQFSMPEPLAPPPTQSGQDAANPYATAVKDMDDLPDEESGNYTCPVCWLKFDAGDAMNIAAHPDLMGDPVLGRDKMLRFLATRFNGRGQALDSTGTPCTDIACPHCRSKLPPHFLDSRDHIFSIIGAPSAGKSYYLASLIHEMESAMPLEFSLAWRDSDPTENSMLNDVSYRLFNATSPETAYLSKTDLEGALYSEFYRHGRMVKLPKPFVYDLYSMSNPKLQTSLIFYDNAGEHFEPGRNSEDSPGARHVAVADGLFFLFDPTSSPAFRRTIGEHSDPQLAPDAPMRMDQQNIIMAETATRISTILNLSSGHQIQTPLAIMIGKSDLWIDKLETELRPIIVGGKIDQAAVDSNSALLRRFLMMLHPSLCSTAETLSSCVRYFAISPLGCSPVKFYDEASRSEKIGPDPKQISPKRICEPTLWVLSQIEPELIPSL